MTDDLLPNHGEYFHLGPTKEQVNEEDKERGKVLASIPIIDDLIERWDESIAATDSNRSVKAEAKARGISHEVMSEVCDILCEKLITEKEYLESLKRMYEV